MSLDWTYEDTIKKHETNVKSATSGFALAGILGIIYIVRFLITENFNFFFSLTSTEVFLRLGESGRLSVGLSWMLTAAFTLVYLVTVIFAAKKPGGLLAALGVYLLDSAAFVPLFLLFPELLPDAFVDVIVHLFVIIFLIAGIRSSRYLTKKR